MNKRKLIWAILSLFIALATIWTVVSQSKTFTPEFFVNNLRTVNKLWLLMSLVCMLGFIWFEGLATVRIARALGFRRNSRQGLVYGAADVYFSAITPSASGGQPASAYFMIKDGMNGSTVAITLLLNLIMYNVALLIIGIVTFIIHGEMVLQMSWLSKLLLVTGSLILLLLILSFYLLLRKEKILYGICNKCIVFLEKIKLLKPGKLLREKLDRSMHQYKGCASVIFRDKQMLADALFLNILQRVSQLGVSFCVFMACGKGAAMSLRAMAMQCFTAIGSNGIPIPGAMGVADYIMLDGFELLVAKSEAITMELLCRGITFYACVLTGGFITILGYISRKRLERRGV